MSAAEQLDLGAIGSPKRRKEPAARFTCKCGHVRDDHANRMHSGACLHCAGGCKRFRPKSKPPVEQPAHLAPPNGAIILERDDLKNYRTMGWAVVGELVGEGIDAFNGVGGAPRLHAIIYLSQLRTKTPNDQRHVWGSTKLTSKQKYGIATKSAEIPRDRTISAIAQLGPDFVAEHGRPTRVVLTRVTQWSKEPDDDGIIGALKFVRDGVAKAFDFDDSEFSIAGVKPNAIRLDYRAEKPGKTGVFGVRIELTWEATS